MSGGGPVRPGGGRGGQGGGGTRLPPPRAPEAILVRAWRPRAPEAAAVPGVTGREGRPLSAAASRGLGRGAGRPCGDKMPAADMAAAPLFPRPAEELKMAAARKCGAERNARQRGKRRPSGNAARPPARRLRPARDSSPAAPAPPPGSALCNRAAAAEPGHGARSPARSCPSGPRAPPSGVVSGAGRGARAGSLTDGRWGPGRAGVAGLRADRYPRLRGSADS